MNTLAIFLFAIPPLAGITRRWPEGTFTDNEITVTGSSENAKTREYRFVLKRTP